MSVSAGDVAAAGERIAPHIVDTPLLRSERIDRTLGCDVYFKAECVQRTGSFKIRGALNRVLQLTDDERRRGVIAWSSGNHAQGIAAAAAQVGTPAVIVMPHDAPEVKRANTAALGAEVVGYDRTREDREALARQIAAERGLIVIPSYDDDAIIAGQGTVGRDLVRQCDQTGTTLDAVFVPVSGGGLIAGTALAVKAAWPSCRMIGAEPAGFGDHRRSHQSGSLSVNPSMGPALCDALLAATPGRLTWPINRRLVDAFLEVDDASVCRAMAIAFRALDAVVEPGGAAAFAAVLGACGDFQGGKIGVVLSGGNVDRSIFEICIREHAAAANSI